MSSLSRIAPLAIRHGILTDDEPAAILYDLGALDARLDDLTRAFPGALHALAVKACPLAALLRRALDRGFGLEVASEGELALARRLGAPPDRVVFDSPAKTRGEIATALAAGVRLNIDNLDELARVEAMAPRGSIGLRLNPVLDPREARIADTFTGGRGSKFGVDLDAQREPIIDAFLRHAWLDGVHVHAGSQGLPLAMMVRAIHRVVGFALELESRGKPIRTVDIGGGLPVRLGDGDPPPSFQDYAAALRAEVPELFSHGWQLITEFGRSIFAPCAVALSRVEYVRPGRVAVVHFGADLLLRAAYRPEQWPYEVVVLDPHGAPRTGAAAPWNIAGPLCFAGDFIARDRPLPDIEPGDLLAVLDVGAYTLSMWSRYNSRPAPAVWGLDGDRLVMLKPRESLDDLLRFWGA